MINDNKKELRKKIRELIKSKPDKELKILSERTAEMLFSLDLWKNADCILTFLSMKGEINTAPIIFRAVKEGKCIGIPRINGKNIKFYDISGIRLETEKDLEPEFNYKLTLNKFGIREPVENLPLIEPSAYSDRHFLITVPGLGFDREKNRLGKGGGYYDRYISELKKSTRNFSLIGICFDFQLMDTVPTAYYDEKVNGIVTDREVIL
ncbi:MAG: 5-formyltetrahydrofolate cyclo-ligase [Spirochaetes bacterium]|nr:MAG: 5-formyltetrahydrofolate cyclo-ligase [Spirochaetota bacterium]